MTQSIRALIIAMILCSTNSVLSDELRSANNQSRDAYRHPIATLNFFEVKPFHTVVEIWPGAGWYTEILAPMLFEQGHLIAAHFPKSSPVEFFRKSRESFEERLQLQPEFSKVTLTEFAPPSLLSIAEKESADRVVTFRNVHNWMRNKGEQSAFNSFFRALKPGGILGVVEHRALTQFTREEMIESGYVSEEYVIALANKAGFKLLEKSEINANPKDTKAHPKGVWTLPPTLRLGDKNREKYLKIGESDRMTLKFIKPKI